MILSIGEFKQYDYGIWQNVFKYNAVSPPSYDLRHIKTPTAIFYSENDLLAAPKVSINLIYLEASEPK